MNGWKHDHRWPEHIIQLANAAVDNEGAWEPLADALLEEGLDKSADHFLRHRRLGVIEAKEGWAYSWLLGVILGDGYKWDKTECGVAEEIANYLDSRELTPSEAG